MSAARFACSSRTTGLCGSLIGSAITCGPDLAILDLLRCVLTGHRPWFSKASPSHDLATVKAMVPLVILARARGGHDGTDKTSRPPFGIIGSLLVMPEPSAFPRPLPVLRHRPQAPGRLAARRRVVPATRWPATLPGR